MTPSAQRTENREATILHWLRRTRSTFKLAVAALPLVGAGVVTGTSRYLTDDPVLVPKIVSGYFFDRDCGRTDDSAVERAGALLDRPDDPYFEQLLQVQDRGKALDLWVQFQRRQAARHGLTVVDSRPHIAALNRAASAEEVIDAFNRFAALQGLELILYTGKTSTRERILGVAPIEAPIDVELLRAGAIVNLRRLSSIPVELIRFSGVEKIRVMGHIDGAIRSDKPVDGTAPGYLPEVWVTLAAFYRDSNTVVHEVGHQIGAKSCGVFGHKRDSEMASTNSPNFQYGTAKAATGAEVARPYGALNPAEDSATVMEDLIAGLNHDTFNPPSGALQAKYSLWLARLTQDVPGFASYVRSISAGGPRQSGLHR